MIHFLARTLDWLTPPRLVLTSFAILAAAWLWTLWSYGRGKRRLAPLRWYMLRSPDEEPWSLGVLNRDHAPPVEAPPPAPAEEIRKTIPDA